MEALSIKEIVEAVNGRLLAGREDTLVHSVSTSSNEIEPGALFVPIKGERVDAHDYIKGALENGAVAVLTNKSKEEIYYHPAFVYIYVDHTLKALQRLATYYRSKFLIPVIGVTGSVGKTTTKEMVAAALETKYKVLKTAGNMNSQVGLPLTMFRLTREHQVAVIEMGMSNEGEIARLAHIAKPTMAIVTNIGVSHIGQLGSKENIRKEKMNVIDAFTDPTYLNVGCLREKAFYLFLNGNDTLLNQVIPYQSSLQQEDNATEIVDLTDESLKALLSCKIAAYGTEPEARFYGKSISSCDGCTHFTFVYPGGKEEITLQVLGEHNVMNACVALGVAYQLGIPASVAKKGLEEYLPIAMRGRIYDKNGVTIIDDSYNASPDSMKSGINVLLQLENVNRRVAVLADVLELGDVSHACHYQVGEYINELYAKNKVIDEVVVIGKAARAIVEAVARHSQTIVTHCFNNNQQAIKYLQNSLECNDALLVKGSRGMHTDEIVKGLLEEK